MASASPAFTHAACPACGWCCPAAYSQLPSLALNCLVPHAVQKPGPEAAQPLRCCPAAHGEQATELLPEENSPLAHDAHKPSEARPHPVRSVPSMHAVHGVQIPAPFAVLYRPSLQSAHAACPDTSLNRPAAPSTHAECLASP